MNDYKSRHRFVLPVVNYEFSDVLYQAGQTIPAIQTALDIKSRQTVYNYLREQGITPGRRKKDSYPSINSHYKQIK